MGRSLGRSLTAPPGKICPIPAVLPTPGAGFDREGGRAERPGQATDLAGRPDPPSPPSRRRRCGKAGGLPSRTSARPPIFNLPPGLTLPQLGSRFPAPVATRVCRRRSRREPEAASGFPSPPRNVNATSAVVVMRREGAHRNLRRPRAQPQRQRSPVPSGAQRAPLGLRAEREKLSAMQAPGLGRPSVSCGYSTRRQGVWGATSRFPAVGLPKLDHGCMAAGPASATGDWSPFFPPRSPGVPPFYVPRIPESSARVRVYSEARGSDGGAQ